MIGDYFNVALVAPRREIAAGPKRHIRPAYINRIKRVHLGENQNRLILRACYGDAFGFRSDPRWNRRGGLTNRAIQRQATRASDRDRAACASINYRAAQSDLIATCQSCADPSRNQGVVLCNNVARSVDNKRIVGVHPSTVFINEIRARSGRTARAVHGIDQSRRRDRCRD